MNTSQYNQILNALKDLMEFLQKEGVLREFPFFINAYDILNSGDMSSELTQEFKTLLLRGMEFAAPGSFFGFGFLEGEQGGTPENQSGIKHVERQAFAISAGYGSS